MLKSMRFNKLLQINCNLNDTLLLLLHSLLKYFQLSIYLLILTMSSITIKIQVNKFDNNIVER